MTKYQQSLRQIILMQDKSHNQFLFMFHVPQQSNYPQLFQFLNENTNSNANDAQPLRQFLHKHDQIIAKIQSVFAHGSVGIGELQDFVEFMCVSYGDFAMLYQKGIPQLTQALSRAITLILRKQLQKQAAGPGQKLVNLLLKALSQQEIILSQNYTFQLFLGLCEIKISELAHKTPEEIAQEIHTCIRYFILIQKYANGNQQYFNVIRNILNNIHHILSQTSSNINPQLFLIKSMQNLGTETRFSYKQQNLTLDSGKQSVSQFCTALQKYILIDPEYRRILLTTITQLFHQNKLSVHLLDLFKVVLSIMNRKIFQNYQLTVMEELAKIRDELTQQKHQLFTKMMFMLFKDKRSPEFLLTFKKFIINFAINQEITILLFSFYYEQVITLKKIKQRNNQILNAVTTWNIKYGMIPPDIFIPELTAIGLEKLNEENQKLIYKNSSLPLWDALALKIVKNKCTEFLEGKLNFQSVLSDECFNSSVEIYCIYTKMFIQVLTNVQAGKFITNPPEFVLLSQNMEMVRKIRDHSRLMFKKALKNKIEDFKFVEPFCLLNSLLEIIRPTNLDRKQTVQFYFHVITKLQIKDLTRFLQELKGIFQICKNSFSFFVILACGIVIYSKYQQEQKQLKQTFTKVLEYVIKLVNTEGFTKITSHKTENLKLLILLTYISKSQYLNKKCQQLISAWAALFNRASIDLILYQFDLTLFQPILSVIDYKFQPEADVQKYTSKILSQLVLLLKHPPCINTKYFTNVNNCINFIPIRHSNHKNSLSIQFKILINPKLCCNSTIEIYGTSKTQKAQAPQKHRLIFKNKKIMFYNRVTKEVQGSFEQVSQQLYYKPFSFNLEFKHSQFKIQINKSELISKKCDFLVDNIRFDLNGDLLIKDFKWERFEQENKLLLPTSTFQIYPSEAEIKLAKTQHFDITSFQDKITLEELCVFLVEIIKNTSSAVDLNKFYSFCCEIVIFKEGQVKNQYSPVELAYVKNLFKAIFQYSQNNTKIDLPDRALEQLNLNTKKCYDFLVVAIISEQFLNQATRECRTRTVSLLQQLLFNKKSDFRFALENRKERMFINLCRSMQKMQKDVRDKYAALIEKIILTHEANQILLKKISSIFSLAHGNKYEYANVMLEKILEKIFSVFNHNQNQENYHIKILGKYVLIAHKNLKIIFLMANIDIKIKILYSMIDDEELCTKCYTLFEDLTPNELLELSGWLVVYSKQTMLEFFDLKKQNDHKLGNLMFLLKQMTIICEVETDEGHKEAFITMINSFILRSVKLINEKCKLEKFQGQVKAFFYAPHLITLVIKKIQKHEQSEIKNKLEENFLINYFENLFTYMPKHVILAALQGLRKIPEDYVNCCLFVLSLDCVLMLSVKSLSPFLQYLIEVIFIARQSEQTQNINRIGDAIDNYLEKLIKNCNTVKWDLARPLYYSYPRVEKRVDFSSPGNINKAVEKAKDALIYELKGGIYFKLMVLNFHLIESFPSDDLSHRISFFFEKVRDKSKVIQPIYRATNDFIQVSTQTKVRSDIDLAMQEVQQQHEKYFQTYDQEIAATPNFPFRKSSSKINIETDLTPYFVDYFFMRMFHFLENHCQKKAGQDQRKIYEAYSKMTLNYLKKFEQVSDQMNEKNVQSLLTYESVEDLSKLIKRQDDITISDRMNSPSVSTRKFIQDSEGNFGGGFGGFGGLGGQSDHLFIGTPKKQKQRSRKISGINFDFTTGKKKKKQLLSSFETNIFAWSEEGSLKKVHRYFRDESKQILFYELLHQLHVLESEFLEKREAPKPKGKELIKFLKDQGQADFEQYKFNNQEWKKRLDKIRRVFKFTCSIKPQYVLKRTELPNHTYPFVHQNINPIQISHQPSKISGINQQNLRSIQFQYSLNSPLPIDTVVCLDIEQNQQSDDLCEISYPVGVYFCSWKIQKSDNQQNKIVFSTKGEKKIEGKGKHIEIQKLLIKYGSPISNIIPDQGKRIQLVVSDIIEIFYRKYNQIMGSSLEFFLKNGESLYIIFYTAKKAKYFLAQCRKSFPNFSSIKTVENYIKQFQDKNYTDKWVSGDLSNFDYLMLVNKYAGRTLCDLNQYYIFPWILDDYTSNTLQISNTKIYRDLKKPIGALNPEKLERYYQKLNAFSRHDEVCLYGSHYSTSLFIYYYMIRLQPYTSLHKEMQSGSFDAADRLFSSIEQMWECLMSQSSMTDIKQSIPQFYYFPTFLKNVNKLDLGKKQNGAVVDGVLLPPWASTPTDFILKMRACFESDYVSSNLNYWIDLIFGKDQKSIQKHNLYYPLAYFENFHPQSIPSQSLGAILDQITYFGQNPYPLFTRQHPKKQIKVASFTLKNISLYTSLELPKQPVVNSQAYQLHEQQNLEMIYYVSDLYWKCRGNIVMKVSGISKSYITRTIDLNMENTIHSLVRAIQKNQVHSMKRLLSQNNIEVPQIKLTTTTKIHQNEIEIYLGRRQKTELIKSMKINYNFTNIKFNQIVFVLYGAAGLRVYDWNQDFVWEFSNKFGEISECFLETGLMFFITCTGKLFVYDFFGRFTDLIFEYPKPTYNTIMLVHQESKSITKKNQNSYKFVIVGDKRKIILLQYTHRIGKPKAKN